MELAMATNRVAISLGLRKKEFMTIEFYALPNSNNLRLKELREYISQESFEIQPTK